MVEFRPIPPDGVDEFQSVLQYAFEPEEGPDHDSGDAPEGESSGAPGEWPPELYEPRGLFDGDTLLSVCKLYYLDVFLGDEFETVGGVGGVATPPERRRQGHVRRLLTCALEEYREGGIDLAMLWPFAVDFYRKLGWGIANKYTVYDLPPEQLAFGPDPGGSVRRLGPDDWNRLRRVEVAFGEGTTLSLRRTERWWRERTLSAWSGRGEPYVYGYERDGELRGYVLHTVEETDDGSRLRVADIAHVDDEAYRGLLRFLSAHDSQVDSVRLPRKEESELLDRVSDPGAVDCTLSVGPMIRLTDVARALEDRVWPEGLDVRFTLSVSDPLLDRNDGTFEVRVVDGSATVETADPGSPRSADVETGVATLSRAFVGSVGIDDAERIGRLGIEDERLREPLRESFPREPVCMREFF